MKLYSFFRSSASYRVRIALNLKRVDYEQLPIHLRRGGGEQFGAAYQAINPQALVPALEDGGRVLIQSLAIMEHPSIAKVFDAGATPDGQPYFVMEYVPGVPITDYCDQKRMKIRERLELFVKVCEGVQHAHQKAIMHRDLKPANILVVEMDGTVFTSVMAFLRKNV